MKRPKRRGRPKTPRKLAKSTLLSVRFSESERKALEQAAAREGIRLSDWARRALLAAISRPTLDGL